MSCILAGILLFLLIICYPMGAQGACNSLEDPSVKKLTVAIGETFTFRIHYNRCLQNGVWSSYTNPNLTNDPSFTVTFEQDSKSIFWSSTLSSVANVSKIGQYYFTIYNSTNKSFSQTFTLIIETRPQVSIMPMALNAAQGDNASLVCNSFSSPITVYVTWYYNGIPDPPLNVTISRNRGLSTFTSTLSFQPLKREHEGRYYCSAFNFFGVYPNFANSVEVFVNVYFPAHYLLRPPVMIQGLAGGNITLFCSVTANPLPPVVYWLTSNGLNLTNISTSVVVSPKVINSTLTLENLQLSHELNYTCFVEQVIPSNNNRTLIEAQTQLLIAYPPQLSSPIHNVTTVNVSDEVTLSCEGFGNPRPVIEWYFTGKDGNEVQIHNASRSLPLSDRIVVSNLTLTNLTIDQEGSYRCKGINNVTNLIGSEEDTSIHLTVQVPPIVLRVNSSSNYSLLVNESITLSFSISSASPPVRTERIIWTLTTVNGNIKELKSDRHNFSLDHLTLTIHSLSLEYNGLIEMTATNEAGISKKNYFLLTGSVPEVYTPPRHMGVAIGTHSASFTCSSSGHPIPLLTWYVNGQELSLSEDKYSLLYANNGTSVLTLFDIGLSDAARYTCFASNVFGNDTVDNHLVVQVPPNVTLTPSQVTVSVTESLQLVCTSYGIPSVVLTWYFGTSKEPLESREGDINITQKTNEYSESLLMTTSILTIENITNAYWQGVFICEGFNGVTNLIEAPENDTSEVIIPIPPRVNVIGSSNLTAVISEPLTIAVSLSISSPPVTLADIMWSFTNASGYTVLINSLSEHHQFSTNLLTLKINDISYSDEGTYEVSVSTTVGNDSTVIAVDVQTPPIPLSHFKRKDVLVGHNATLFCEATSEPIHRFQWKFNGNFISENDVRYIISDDQWGEYGRLIITNTSPSDAGEYTCTVSNVHGVANITVILDILVPPVLQYQPKSEPPYVDHSYSISVRVTNIPNPPVNSSSIAFKKIDDTSLSQVDIIYQKSMRLVNISFTNISVSDNGTYQLTVKNIAGEDTVDNITLNVKALPLIFTSSRAILLDEGESTSVGCKADGLPLPSVTWLANRRQIGAFSSTFTITTVAIDSIRQGVPAVISRLNATDLLQTHNGSYECVVENQEGTTRIQYNISVIPVNFCASNPCKNGGTCSSGTSSYRCSCTEQWTGKNCDETATSPREPYFFTNYNRTFYREFGSSVLLSCPVTGYPQPNIIWFKDDVLLHGAITEDYEIKKLDLNTRGIYRCKATNELGSIVSDDMTVKIRGLVQYLINITFSKEFNDKFFEHEIRRRRQVDDTYKATEERLNELIGRIESDLKILLKQNNSLNFEFISISQHGNTTSLLQPIQLILTLLSQSGGSDLLKSIVGDAFNKLKRQLAMSYGTDDDPFSNTVARFDGCTPVTTVIPSPNGDPNLDFAFPWPETDLSQIITLRCPCGPEGFDIGVVRNATRRCGGNFETGAVWESPIDEACNFSTSARELCALASLDEAVEVLTGLDNITAVTEDIGSLELSISTVFVENLTAIVRGDRTFTETFLTVTDNLLSIDENAIIDSNEEARTSGRLLQSFEEVVDDIPVKSNDNNNSTIILRTKFAVAVQELDTSSFDDDESLIFSVTNNAEDFSSTDSVSFFDDFNDPSAQIVIPGSILRNLALNSSVRLVQTAFETDALFLRRNSLVREYSYLQLGSILVSASFVKYNISNQEDLINITLKKDKIQHINTICSYWNYTADDNYGNWSNYGCSVLYEDSDTVICGCNHLTTFALLLDVSPEGEGNRPPPFTEFATALTFLGCAISILCLVLIILTYSIEKRLRNTNNGKLLINMSSALVGLYVFFIPASYAAPIEELCVVVGAFLHYFFLVTFLSMASEATILYVELVKVFASDKSNMIMKAVLVTWVTPFFLVALTLAPDYKNYAYDRLCRPKDWQYWIGYIGPFSVIYIYNWIMFLIIVISLSKQQCKMKSQTGNTSLQSTTAKQLILMITLSILFGLGWGLGLASTSKFPIQWLRYSFEVAFIIVVTFQGLFIFILYGVKVEKVRKTWLKWFYAVTCQHEKAQRVEYSLKSTSYSMRQSGKKAKTLQYSLGTYDSNASIELKKVNQSQFISASPSPEPAEKLAITESTVKKLLILEGGKLNTEELANNCKSKDLDNKSGEA